MSGKERARLTFAWLSQVAADHANLPALATVVAIKLTKFFHPETGDAWMSQATLAEACQATDRAIRNNLAALVERGHLTVVKARGRSRSNTYKMALKNRNDYSGIKKGKSERAFLHSDEKTGTIEQKNRNERVEKTGTNVPTILLNEPSKGTILDLAHDAADLFASEDAAAHPEGENSDQPPSTTAAVANREAPASSRSGARRARRSPARPIPHDFVPDIAFAERLGLNPEIEMAKFRDHALATDRRCADWSAAFRNWCRRGAEMAKRNGNGSGKLIDAAGNVIDEPQPRRSRGRTYLEIAQEMNRRDMGGVDE